MGRRALHCIVTMRSSDVWLGIPYDVFSFTQIQSAFAGMLGVRRGWLSLHMGSSHLYERDVAAAQGVLETFAPGTITSPDLPDWPPQWLEHVLRDRDMKHVPEDAPLCWRTYAMVLTSPSSEAARGWLR
jgi:thymidylate synthase